jgi:hypothetical protein
MAEKITKASVNYRRAAPAHVGGRRCGTCSMFVPPGACTLVRGPIRARDVCDRWEPKESG